MPVFRSPVDSSPILETKKTDSAPSEIRSRPAASGRLHHSNPERSLGKNAGGRRVKHERACFKQLIGTKLLVPLWSVKLSIAI